LLGLAVKHGAGLLGEPIADVIMSARNLSPDLAGDSRRFRLRGMGTTGFFSAVTDSRGHNLLSDISRSADRTFQQPG
jgi:hypothetical protein